MENPPGDEDRAAGQDDRARRGFIDGIVLAQRNQPQDERDRQQESELRRPLLLHGLDATVWPFVALAADRRWSTRVGLEDGSLLPGGAIASGNAALVAAAVDVYRCRCA